ncbi:hypothetical protein [Nocardioides sp. Iso805N]|uniref:hypothetical protein n=1 Tax=Nocardioides sp. Iso805N TaxID=1283287 RepID=UPI00038199E9|nr:hypothetical protein [Nocardioides sp. Iso805N]
MNKLIALTMGALVATLGLTTMPAHAGPATGNGQAGPGGTIRNLFEQNVDGSGYTWTTYGTSACTATTSDVDDSYADMDKQHNWDNVASFAHDYNGCDTKLYQFTNFDTALTGWVNYGSAGQSLAGAALNNKTSSYKLS